MSEHYFQVAFQLHVLSQYITHDVLKGRIFLSASRNDPDDNVVSFWSVLEVFEFFFQDGNLRAVRFTTQSIFEHLHLLISKIKPLL